MRILHYYQKDDTMVRQHVEMLCRNMDLEAECHMASEAEQARTLLRGGHYDLVHLHGCWRNSSRIIVNLALQQGTRVVLTPHGQLEPWVMNERRWKEKMPKRVLYQRNIVRQSYAVIVQGQMERMALEQLAWNPRTVIIRNAVITQSIQPQEMARQTYALYRKVMDSNPLELMSDDIRIALRNILKAGITGDKRWVVNADYHHPVISHEEWRLLLCYAHQEHISTILQRGIRVLELNPPDIDPQKIDYFLPAHYVEVNSIKHELGNQFASENERLLATFRLLRKWAASQQYCISHLVELDQELRLYGCKEDKLCETLRERHLYKMAARTIQLLQDLTGMDEGFMPMMPINDRLTRQLRCQIEGRLKI